MFSLHQNFDHIDLFMVKPMVLVFSLFPSLVEPELDRDDKNRRQEGTEFDMLLVVESIE